MEPGTRSAFRAAAKEGALLAPLALVAFFVLHALVVRPIWTRVDAWGRGALLALFAGVLAAFMLRRLAGREPRFAMPLGGMLVGALAGLMLLPFALAGWMRARGAPDPFWLLILALLVSSVYHVTQAVQEAPGRLRRVELFAALLGLNAFPAYFLTFIADFHEEMPDPFPFTLALATIYVAGGALLDALRQRGS